MGRNTRPQSNKRKLKRKLQKDFDVSHSKQVMEKLKLKRTGTI